MSEEEKSFRERLGNDVKTVKRMLYGEEICSALYALTFGMNLACLVVFPLSGFSVLNGIALWWVMKKFKPTIKKQEVLHLHLKLLKTIKDEKVWTQGDKK